MNTATNDSETMTVSHDEVNGRNGYQNGKTAIRRTADPRHWSVPPEFHPRRRR